MAATPLGAGLAARVLDAPVAWADVPDAEPGRGPSELLAELVWGLFILWWGQGAIRE
jgi:hypothetical protein